MMMRSFSSVVLVFLLALGSCAGRSTSALPFAHAAARAHSASADTLLHSFGNTGDGYNPSGPLVLLNGLWYGTTQYGGKYRNGTVFTIDANGNEKILHDFGFKKDGAQPFAGLIVVKGTLYGTTEIGGRKGKGTVFSITPAGVEHVLHSFTGSPDGWGPQASLVYARGTLYGTTYYGGTVAQSGVVFGVTLGGKESIVHTFTDGKDGATPVAPLIYSRGVLYGTSVAGGSQGQGAAYSIDLSGKFKTLHSFSPSDNWPTGMVMVNGVLYGTTDGHTDNVGVFYSLTTKASTPSSTRFCKTAASMRSTRTDRSLRSET
jgi:uncharacterized repeat protein (TIGR03803 family)